MVSAAAPKCRNAADSLFLGGNSEANNVFVISSEGYRADSAKALTISNRACKLVEYLFDDSELVKGNVLGLEMLNIENNEKQTKDQLCPKRLQIISQQLRLDFGGDPSWAKIEYSTGLPKSVITAINAKCRGKVRTNAGKQRVETSV